MNFFDRKSPALIKQSYRCLRPRNTNVWQVVSLFLETLHLNNHFPVSTEEDLTALQNKFRGAHRLNSSRCQFRAISHEDSKRTDKAAVKSRFTDAFSSPLSTCSLFYTSANAEHTGCAPAYFIVLSYIRL